MRIAVDLDNTIANFTKGWVDKVKDRYGVELAEEDITTYDGPMRILWEQMSQDQRDLHTEPRDLLHDICTDGFYTWLEPYPGAIQVVKDLYDAGHEIIFLTKAINWHGATHGKGKWIKKHFGDIECLTIMVDSTQAKHIIDVDVIIDDDPRVLEGITTAVPICIAQPWNESIRYKIPFVVDNMAGAKEIIDQLEKQHLIQDKWFKNETKVN